MLPGRGVSAMVHGREILIGNTELLSSNSISVPQDVVSTVDACLHDGATVMYVAVDGRFTGFVSLSDTLREDAPVVIRELKAMNIRPVLLTGDNQNAASHIAEVIGIDDVHAECLPAKKLETIDWYQESGSKVCMDRLVSGKWQQSVYDRRRRQRCPCPETFVCRHCYGRNWQ